MTLFQSVEAKFQSYLCFRGDGSVVQVDGSAMILPSEQVNGLYTCWASFYHHKASINIQVEVTSGDELISKYLCSRTCLFKLLMLAELPLPAV